jgi:hypothetical protein
LFMAGSRRAGGGQCGWQYGWTQGRNCRSVKGDKITKVHPPCVPTEEEGSANHCSGPGVDMLAEGDAEDDMVGGKGAIAAWSRGTK